MNPRGRKLAALLVLTMMLALGRPALLLAQNEPKLPDLKSFGEAEPNPLALVCGMLCGLLLAVPFIMARWKIYTKAGKPGWASIIPIYADVVLLQICQRPMWWLAFFYVPCLWPVLFVFIWLLCMDLAKAFGKGMGFGLGLFFLGPIFILILGFGSAQYQGGPALAAGARPGMPRPGPGGPRPGGPGPQRPPGAGPQRPPGPRPGGPPRR